MSHYLAGTEFQLATRVFNSNVKEGIAHSRMPFKQMDLDQIKAVGLDEHYSGFSLVTTEALLKDITSRSKVVGTVQNELKNQNETLTSSPP